MNADYFMNLLRFAFRDKAVALLGVLCLVVGLGSVLLVTVHVLYINSFETHINRSADVYRVVVNLNSRSTGQPYELSFTSDAYAPVLQDAYPEQIEQIGRIKPQSGVFTFADAQRRDLDFHFVDETIIDIFDFQFIHSSTDSPIAQPYSAAVSQSFAERYFGRPDPLGETLTVFGDTVNITAVFTDSPNNTHMQFDLVLSSETGRRMFNENFMAAAPWIQFSDTRTYTRLFPGTNATELARDFPALVSRHIPEAERRLAEDSFFALDLQPIQSIHLNPREGGFNGVDNSVSLTLVSLIAFSATVLTLAFINYLSLSVSRLIKRSREIAIRRVLGASRKDLALQFAAESAVVVLLSLMLAAPFVYAIFPVYSHYVGITLSAADIPFFAVMLFALTLLLIMSIVAACFALYVISNDTQDDLKGGRFKSARGLRIAILASAVQVSLSLILILLSASIYLHTRNLYDADLGFEHEGLVLVDLKEFPSANSQFDYTRLLSELTAIPAVTGVSAATFHPARTLGFVPWRSEEMLPEETASVGYVIVDENFIDIYGLSLIAGRSLSTANAADVMPSFSPGDSLFNMVITDYAAATFGFDEPQDAIGQTVESAMIGGFTVVGVIDNFRLSSLHGSQNSPGVILASTRPMQYINLRYALGEERSVLSQIDNILRGTEGRNEFDYELYVDIESAAIEDRAQGVSVAAVSSAVTSVMIAVFGFVALVLFISSIRTASTAVRRVLGAGELRSILPLLRDLNVILTVAFVISLGGIYFIQTAILSLFGFTSVPLAYYVVMSLLICALFSVLALAIGFTANRKVLDSIFE